MIYTELTKKALKIAYEAHKEQYDKSGMPYIFHPYEVAEDMKTEEGVVTALLHDVVEDSNVTFEDLIAVGIPDNAIIALKLLTHNDETPYLEYVTKIKINSLAKTVKLADLKHNSDLTRIEEPNEWDYKRIDKYKKAIDILQK